MTQPYKRKEQIGDATLYLGDCMEILPTLEGYDAVLADPPYGIAYSHGGGGGKLAKSTEHAKKPIVGDDSPFDPAPWTAQPAILWGGNHFACSLPASSFWIVWDKRCADYSNDQADCELAWTNLKGPARMIRHAWNGMIRGKESKTPRQHPTQKPIAVMEKCLTFLPDTGTIFDPFMGSGTTGVACANLGRKFIGIEICESHFNTACERIAAAYAQGRLFS